MDIKPVIVPTPPATPVQKIEPRDETSRDDKQRRHDDESPPQNDADRSGHQIDTYA